METSSNQTRIWTRVSPDGKSAAAGAGMAASIGLKPGAGGEPQPYGEGGQYLGTLYAANGRARTASGVGKVPRKSPLGVGMERGKKSGKYYVLPPAVKAENERIALVYSQKDGTLMDMEDRLVGQGYSGAPGHVNMPESQDKKDLGVIPEGTWTIGPVIEKATDTGGKGENLIKLVPDQATADRVRAMGRDPDTFYIHAGKVNGERTASQGCIIILDKSERRALRELQGAKIRVVC